MSIPYLVHKEDADAYDAICNAIYEFERKIWKEIDGNEDLEFSDENQKRFKEMKALLDRKYGRPRTISGFEAMPNDIENYFTYIRGIRFGPAASCELRKVTQDGIDACMKVIKKISDRTEEYGKK